MVVRRRFKSMLSTDAIAPEASPAARGLCVWFLLGLRPIMAPAVAARTALAEFMAALGSITIPAPLRARLKPARPSITPLVRSGPVTRAGPSPVALFLVKRSWFSSAETIALARAECLPGPFPSPWPS